MKHYCYICGNEITDENSTDEHIILNAIGGHLHSYIIICKECNNRIGETADAKLAEDLSFYTDMLGVKKNRQNEHDQIMTDIDGHEIIVKDGGKSMLLRKPYVSNVEKEGVREVQMTVHEELHDVIDKAFAKFPEGCVMTPEKMAIVQNDVMSFFEKLINRSEK